MPSHPGKKEKFEFNSIQSPPFQWGVGGPVSPGVKRFLKGSGSKPEISFPVGGLEMGTGTRMGKTTHPVGKKAGPGPLPLILRRL